MCVGGCIISSSPVATKAFYVVCVVLILPHHERSSVFICPIIPSGPCRQPAPLSLIDQRAVGTLVVNFDFN